VVPVNAEGGAWWVLLAPHVHVAAHNRQFDGLGIQTVTNEAAAWCYTSSFQTRLINYESHGAQEVNLQY
jgi:hypothetical protein